MKSTTRILLITGIAIFTALFFFHRDFRIAPPVSVSYRKSFVGKGIVLNVQNDATEYMREIVVRVKRHGDVIATHGLAERLAPGDALNVGWMELGGVQLQRHDEVEVYAKGYTCCKHVVPE